jgi:BNR repeat-containing family member
MISGGLAAAFAAVLVVASNALGPVEVRSQLPLALAPNVLAASTLVCNKDLGVPGDSSASPTYRFFSTTQVGTTWAGQPVGQDILVAGNRQYVGYYDGHRRLIVKSRVGAGGWTTKVLDTSVDWDSHKYITMELDINGNLHVAGNMHDSKLNYYITSSPGNIATLARVPTLANSTLESAVTYPQFLKSASGELYFKFRYGRSGNGSEYIYRFVAPSRKWQIVVSGGILNGQGTSSAYSTSPIPGPDGYFHMVWMWRDTTDVSTNHSLSYARTKDFIHWQNIQGANLAVPMTKQSPTTVDPATVGSGLVNGIVGIGFDSANRPVISYTRYDAARGNQLFLARGDTSGTWYRTRITRWNGVFAVQGTGSLRFPFSVGAVKKAANGTLQLNYTCNSETRTVVLDEKSLGVKSDNPLPSPLVGSPVLPVLRNDPQLVTNRTSTKSGTRVYILQWRSMPVNGDKPRAVIPPAEPLLILEYRAQ